MKEKTMEVSTVAQRLSLHPATIRRMFAAGLLQGFKTGPSGTRIRIFSSSVDEHMQQYAQAERGNL